MKGAKIGYTTAGSISQINAEWMLKQAGLSTKDATLVQVGGGSAASAAMQRGSIDMTLATPPDVQQLSAGGASVVLVNGLAEFPVMASQPYSVVLADPGWLKTNADIAKKFTAALAQGIAFINQDPVQASKLLQPRFPDVPADQLAAGLQSMVPTYTAGGVMTQSMWENAITMGQDAGVLGNKLSPAEGELWTNDYNGAVTGAQGAGTTTGDGQTTTSSGS